MAQLIVKCFVVILSLYSFSYLTEAFPYRPFHMFWLALTWPPAFCVRHNCRYEPIPTDFIIHGFWPDKRNGNKLEYCEDVPYTPITDEVLLGKVKANWISLSNAVERQTGWWAYQWERHGTCSLLFYNQMAYFDLAVKLREQIDIYGYLAANGIVPTNQYLFPVADIANTIQQRTGRVPHLYCEKFNRRQQMLVEVTLCYDPDGGWLMAYRAGGKEVAQMKKSTIFPMRNNSVRTNTIPFLFFLLNLTFIIILVILIR